MEMELDGRISFLDIYTGMAERSWGLPKKNNHTVLYLRYCPITTNILTSYGMFVVSLWIFVKIAPLGAEIERKIYYGLHVKCP